jgi:hypothetical protein
MTRAHVHTKQKTPTITSDKRETKKKKEETKQIKAKKGTHTKLCQDLLLALLFR